MRVPESRKCSVLIDAPLEDVFACVRNPTNFNQLMPGVTFSDFDVTPDGVGTAHGFETRVAGIPIRGTGEFTEFTPNRHIHDETSIAMEGSIDWTFEGEGEGVRVTIEHSPGRFWDLPIVGRLLANTYQHSDRGVLRQLKCKLEIGQRG